MTPRAVAASALLLGLALAVPAPAQDEPGPVAPGEPAVSWPPGISPIPGTRVGIELPPGFALSDRFTGIVHEDTSASIVVSEIPAPSEIIRASMTRERLGPGGLTLHEIEDVEVAGVAGSLAYASQVSEGIAYRKWILVFGDEERTVSLVAMVPSIYSDRMKETLLTAIRGAAWDPAREIDLFEGLLFRVEETTGLRLSERVARMLFLTKPRGEGPLAPGDPLFIVGISQEEDEPSELAQLARRKLLEIEDVREVVFVAEQPIALDGLAGYETVAEAEDIATRAPVLVYQALARHPKGGLILMQGLVGEERAARYLAQFRSIAASFRVSEAVTGGSRPDPPAFEPDAGDEAPI